MGLGPPTPGTLMAAAGTEQSKRQLYKLCGGGCFNILAMDVIPTLTILPKQVGNPKLGEMGELDRHS